MNTGVSSNVNKENKKKCLSKSNDTKKPGNRRGKSCGVETQSANDCPLDAEKHKTSTRNDSGNFDTFQKTFQVSYSEPETPIPDFNDEIKNTLSREEIILRRKLKVAARKQIKKLDKPQLSNNVSSEQVNKLGFSLKLASEEFPSLDAHKTKKKSCTSYHKTVAPGVENVSVEKSSVTQDPKTSKTTDKSWKPKVKDPILIDLSQVLINTTEKHRPVLKKADVPIQRNLLAGNILDSDNPTRKRGKVRPDKVQKPSKLKNHILNERKKKMSGIRDDNSVWCEGLSTETTEKDITIAVENASFINCGLTDTKENRTVSENKLTNNNKNLDCQSVSPNLHSRRFREYCTNCLTEGLLTSVSSLLEKIAYFQDRMYAREPIKASAKRRYVAGINQVNKYLRVKKVKLLVIAPDLEKIPGEGGLDGIVQYFKTEAESQSIPCVFGPNRKRLGKAVKKNTLVSCVAILSYEGAEEQFGKVVEALNEARTKYLRLTGCDEDNATNNNLVINVEDISTLKAEDVTSSLLAKLREELPPSDRLLNAIQHCGSV